MYKEMKDLRKAASDVILGSVLIYYLDIWHSIEEINLVNASMTKFMGIWKQTSDVQES